MFTVNWQLFSVIYHVKASLNCSFQWKKKNGEEKKNEDEGKYVARALIECDICELGRRSRVNCMRGGR